MEINKRAKIKVKENRANTLLFFCVKEGFTIIHDGNHSHYELIEQLHAKEEFYKASAKSKEYLEHMELINSMCSWLKRSIWRFTSMKVENLQSYLNWFVYRQKVKRQQDKWEKSSRIMKHLLLNESKYIRKYRIIYQHDYRLLEKNQNNIFHASKP